MRGFLGRRAVRVVVVVALVVVVVFFLFLLLNWYVAPAEPGASVRKDLILAVAQILGGTALLSGLYFTWRTLQVNREGQITERFTRAIDQLGKVDDKGNKLFEIRVGGIYALERIARESGKDYWPVMEILTAYVRQNAPWIPEKGQGGTDGATRAENAMEGSGGKSEATDVFYPDPLVPDIHAIMTVLRRRTRYYEHGESESLYLHMTDLSMVNLSETNLAGANLFRTNLYGAQLYRTNFSETTLIQANFAKAHLVQANFSGALLGDTDFSGANLSGADLSGVDLSGTDLSGTILSGTNLSETNLYGADLSKTEYLSQAQLEQAYVNESTRLPPHLGWLWGK